MAVDEIPPLERMLWKRVRYGTAIGMAALTIIGFAQVSVGGPDVTLWGRIGIALFVGFWSGPFFGMAGAVGYHEITLARSHTAKFAVASPTVTPTPLEGCCVIVAGRQTFLQVHIEPRASAGRVSAPVRWRMCGRRVEKCGTVPFDLRCSREASAPNECNSHLHVSR